VNKQEMIFNLIASNVPSHDALLGAASAFRVALDALESHLAPQRT